MVFVAIHITLLLFKPKLVNPIHGCRTSYFDFQLNSILGHSLLAFFDIYLQSSTHRERSHRSVSPKITF